jgi:hypothetical protein
MRDQPIGVLGGLPGSVRLVLILAAAGIAKITTTADTQRVKLALTAFIGVRGEGAAA